MDELLSIFIKASDPNCEEFDQSQRMLVELSQKQPIEITFQIVDILREHNNQDKIQFLLLIYLTHSFEQLFKRNIQFDVKSFENTMIPIIFNLFSCENDEVRSAAVNLLSKIITFDEKVLYDQIFINMIISFLTSDNKQTVLSSLDFIRSFCPHVPLNDELTQILFGQVINYITSNDEDIVIHTIQLFSEDPMSVFVLFQTDEEQKNFIDAILSLVSNTTFKKYVLEFSEQFLVLNPKKINFIFPIFNQIVSDLTSTDINDNELFHSLYTLGAIVQNDLKLKDLTFLSENVKQICEILISLLSKEEIDNPKDDEYDVSTLPHHILRDLAEKYFEQIYPLLVNKVDEYEQSTDVNNRIAAAKCLVIICTQIKQIPEKLFSEVYEKVTMFSGGENSNVVFYALTGYALLVESNQSCENFLSDIETLFELSHSEIYGEKAMVCIAKITDCQDFSSYEIFSILAEKINEFDIKTQKMVALMFRRFLQEHNQLQDESILLLFESILKILQDCDIQIAETILTCIPYILPEINTSVQDSYNDLYALFSEWLQNGAFAALTAISYLYYVDSSKFDVETILNTIAQMLDSEESEAEKFAIISYFQLFLIFHENIFKYDQIPLKILQLISYDSDKIVRLNALYLFPQLITTAPQELVIAIFKQYNEFISSEFFVEESAQMDQEFVSSIIEFAIQCINMKELALGFKIIKRIIIDMRFLPDIPREVIESLYKILSSYKIPQFIQLAAYINQMYLSEDE